MLPSEAGVKVTPGLRQPHLVHIVTCHLRFPLGKPLHAKESRRPLCQSIIEAILDRI